ncbi:MAG TPA: hypothetical protein VKZ84_03640 [Bacteriovoracaceae bacterium]|nr:hypothetical protein [Bacteriovoracaceae bacterium]
MIKFLLAFVLVNVSNVYASELTNELIVSKVRNSSTNQIASQSGSSFTCEEFKGTYQGNTLTLKPRAFGGSGRYQHRLVWQLSESYKTFDLKRKQYDIFIKDGNWYNFTIPELKDDVPFIQQTIFLITQDLRTGESKTTQLIFNVSRPVILTQTNKPEKYKNNCFQVMPAFESVSGIMSNSSTNPSNITISQGIQSIWTKTNGSQWGYYVSPLSWTIVGNIFSIYRNYMTQFSRQTIETVEVSNGYTIAPGDFVQLYEQRTRYVSSFDAHVVSPCGEMEELEGDYFLQWWGVAYHAVPVNPYSDSVLPKEAIGIAPLNTCPESLTPEFYKDNNDFIFSRTN